MSLLTFGDFVDLSQKVRVRGWGYLASKLRLSSSDRVRATYNAAHSYASYWWNVKSVHRRWNRAITGNSEKTFEEYVCENFLSQRESRRILSLGCGNGNEELLFASMPSVQSVTGIDLCEGPIEQAKANARERGIENVEFRVGDVCAADFDLDESYDIILFQMSLHHFHQLERLLLEQVPRWLKPDGYVVMNEFVGPTRWQWSDAQLQRINSLLTTLPRRLRMRFGRSTPKQRVYRPGTLRMILNDPSESIRSGEILQVMRNGFNIVEEKPYGGNLLALLLQDIAHNFQDDDAESMQHLERLFEEEDRFVEQQQHSDYLFGVYRPKAA